MNLKKIKDSRILDSEEKQQVVSVLKRQLEEKFNEQDYLTVSTPDRPGESWSTMTRQEALEEGGDGDPRVEALQGNKKPYVVYYSDWNDTGDVYEAFAATRKEVIDHFLNLDPIDMHVEFVQAGVPVSALRWCWLEEDVPVDMDEETEKKLPSDVREKVAEIRENYGSSYTGYFSTEPEEGLNDVSDTEIDEIIAKFAEKIASKIKEDYVFPYNEEESFLARNKKLSSFYQGLSFKEYSKFNEKLRDKINEALKRKGYTTYYCYSVFFGQDAPFEIGISEPES